MSIRSKTSSSALRDKFVKRETEKKTKKGGDKRFLNYYDLDEGDKMTIRLLPDGGDSGEYWLEYATHGGNLKTRGVESISCAYTSSGEDCPACAHSFEYYNDGDKDEAQRWRRKETYIGQCLVIDSPIEVNETDDENPVKLLYLPYSVIEEITESIMEQKIGEIIDHDFVIKKTVGKNGYAGYGKSYFNTSEEPLSDDVLDMFEDGSLKLFDLSEELPEASSTDDVEEWLDKTIEIDEKANRRRGAGKKSTRTKSDDDDHDDDEDDDKPEKSEKKSTKKVSGSALLNKLKKKEKSGK